MSAPTPEEAVAEFVATYGEPETREYKVGTKPNVWTHREPSYGGEGFHIETDALMEELLTQLGYGDLVERIQFGTRWYS